MKMLYKVLQLTRIPETPYYFDINIFTNLLILIL